MGLDMDLDRTLSNLKLKASQNTPDILEQRRLDFRLKVYQFKKDTPLLYSFIKLMIAILIIAIILFSWSKYMLS